MYPPGMYGTWSPGNGSLAPLQKAIVGVYATLPWTTLEPTEGFYALSALTNMLTEAESLGLAVRLAIDASPVHSPAYVKSGSVQIGMIDTVKYRPTYGTKLFGPLPWDAYYLARKAALIRYVASQVAGHPSIVAVGNPHPCWQTTDTVIPHAVGTWGGNFQDQPADWLAAGYTHAGMVASGNNDNLDVVAVAFPNATVVQPLHPTASSMDGRLSQLPADLAVHGYGSYPGRYAVECCDLSATTPTAQALGTPTVDDATWVYSVIRSQGPQGAAGWQLISAANDSSGDNSRLNGGVNGDPATVLRKVIDIGLTYKPHFIEVWWQDATDPALAAVLDYGTRQMNGTPRP